jgi:metallophosphoesterase (TIGR00282 family)
MQKIKLAFLGDIVGRPARSALTNHLARLRSENGWDVVVANGENAAAGAGLTAKLAQEILDAGVDAITLGDHVWDQKNFPSEIDQLDKVCRPANLPAIAPGRPSLLLPTPLGRPLAIFTVLGRQFLNVKSDCPFLTADRLIDEFNKDNAIIFAEIHAEATSEKIAFGWFLDGRVAAVAGTHTHVPTADARILERGTAYITDVGMCGPYRSVLGREVTPVISKFLDGLPRRFEVASDDVRICGLEVEISEDGAALACRRIEVFVEG